MSQLSFLSIGMKKKLRGYEALEEVSKVVPWKELCEEVQPYYPKGEGGRPVKPLELMLKIYCLQLWYNLSDPAMEDAIYDRNSFQQFLKIDLLGNVSVPDETTILKFRRLLEKHELGEKIFARIRDYLLAKGVMLQGGTIADATIIPAPSGSKKIRERNPEMSTTRKGNSYYYGMKAHIGVDAQSGLVHTVKSTTARTNDVDMLSELLHGKEKAVFGDKGYPKKAFKKVCEEKGIFYGILRKAERYYKLTAQDDRWNHRLSRVRSKVEHPFRIVKHLWHHRKTRYRGLAKNHNQFCMLFGLSNLYMVRGKLCPA